MRAAYSIIRGLLGVVSLAALAASCAPSIESGSRLESRVISVESSGVGVGKKQKKLAEFLARADNREREEFQGFVQRGSDDLTGRTKTQLLGSGVLEGKTVSLSLLNAPISQAAKAVLGDTLGVSYTVDTRVQGSITLETSRSVSRKMLLELFEAALRDSGAAIAAGNGTYRIIPLAEAARTVATIRTDKDGSEEPGIRPQVVPLLYVSAENMRQLLEPIIPGGMVVQSDTARNALVLMGNPREVSAIRETISVFDIDWMKGMSFALVPVKSSSPAGIVQDLEQIFETRSGVLKGVVRFVPNSRLRSVLVISSRVRYVDEATRWIRKLDVLSATSEASLHVYRVQNRVASELARTLEMIFPPPPTLAASPGVQESVAPRFESSTVGEAGSVSAVAITGGPETPSSGVDVLAPADHSPATDQLALGPRGRIIADDSNNALLIYGTRAEFERIKLALVELDVVPNQVLLEAVIAEVTLDDDLKFGIRWFLGQSGHGGSFSDAANGAISSVFPGFSYFLKSSDVGFTLNAISSVTNVRVLSAPSLVVLDNRTATLQVGDQVPVVTQSAQATTGQNAPIISSVELKDTGVILNVTPRVNDSGLVTLDIEQEVSSVTKTTTSGIDSPTIRQRKLKTSVAVNDNESLALGGLIQERENRGVSKVPVLGDVPILGTAFRQKSESLARTELIIFIRPRVIRDLAEARRVTDEFRRQLSIQAPRVRRSEPEPREELVRIFN